MSILEARRTKDFHLASLLNSSNSSIPLQFFSNKSISRIRIKFAFSSLLNLRQSFIRTSNEVKVGTTSLFRLIPRLENLFLFVISLINAEMGDICFSCVAFLALIVFCSIFWRHCLYQSSQLPSM